MTEMLLVWKVPQDNGAAKGVTEAVMAGTRCRNKTTESEENDEVDRRDAFRVVSRDMPTRLPAMFAPSWRGMQAGIANTNQWIS